jgi:hypothetical protein
MQAAHWSINWVGLPAFGAVVVLPRVLASPLLVLKLATWGGFVEPPLQAASPMAAAATRIVSPPDRRYLRVMCRNIPCTLRAALSARPLLPFICSLSSKRSWQPLYEMEGHSPVMVVTCA